jgi:integrase
MARLIDRLSPRFVKTAKPKRGQDKTNYLDGGGLHLAVTKSVDNTFNRSWVFKYELHGKRREIGLGPLHDVGLADAREEGKRLRGLLRQHIDPLDHKHAEQRARKVEAGKKVKFRDDADAYMNLHEAGWSKVHTRQWRRSIARYVYPAIGDMPVSEIVPSTLLQIITPIWKTKTETASRLINRLELILAFSTGHDHREGDNPASNLRSLLPKKSKVSKIENFEAVPYAQVPAVMAQLGDIDTIGSKALRFLTLCVARPGEVQGATYDELQGDTWVIPGARMKRGKRHRVPLSAQAIAILESIPRVGERIFAGLTEKAMRAALQRLPGYKDATVHGMRSAFKQWAETEQDIAIAPRNVIELSLAHAVALDDTEEAYMRDVDLLERRRPLMKAWGEYCTAPPVKRALQEQPTGEVVPIRKARA